MKYSELKYLLNKTDRDTVQSFLDGDNFTDNNFLITSKEDANEIVYNNYTGDEYMLGCFNAEFLQEYICLDYDTIKILQDSEAYEGIGRAIINSGNFKAMMDAYIEADGYGYALSSYEGNFEECTLHNGTELIIIRQN